MMLSVNTTVQTLDDRRFLLYVGHYSCKFTNNIWNEQDDWPKKTGVIYICLRISKTILYIRTACCNQTKKKEIYFERFASRWRCNNFYSSSSMGSGQYLFEKCLVKRIWQKSLTYYSSSKARINMRKIYLHSTQWNCLQQMQNVLYFYIV